MREVSVTIGPDGKKAATFYGTSSEAKPTQNIAMVSVFIEVDTGKAYLYNESSSTWIEQ
jgi:hypothetical protein